MTTAVLICPGRGTYNKPELGYLGRHFPDRAILKAFDAQRADRGQPSLTKLDGAGRYSVAQHTRGDNASALIYAASLGDALSIDRAAIDIVAVAGNSMGWYSTLACAGAVAPEDGFEIANTMGTLMQDHMIGGQVIYPFLGPDWRPDPDAKTALMKVVAEIGSRAVHVLALSIDLGGMLVLAGNDAGLSAFEKAVPEAQGRYPIRLANHAAFHTPLQAPVAAAGRDLLARGAFGQPKVPMIDGRGAIWWPGASDRDALYDYTLGAQVTQPYDFTRAVTIAAREFAPDLFILAGPGDTLGGAIAQSLILSEWAGLTDKADFVARQSDTPLLVSMGRADQRSLVVRAGPDA